ncbi:MAG: PQQ-like beta-propeller repeat protein [Deltaproteobacteria bacterium]|nr:PQQ-like beta-propeller repeat protein [Deltaproteobacteria bacterium]
MLHLDPARTNRSPFVGPADPLLLWSFEAGAPIETAPAQLADGTVVIGTLGGKLIGVSPEGRQTMALDLHERVYSSPWIDRDGIYLGSDAHKFFAISSKGAVRWQLDTDGDADTAAAPTPWGAMVFASGRVLYAVRPNASVVWRVKAKRKLYGAPAVAADGTVYAGSQDNRLYAVQPDGQVKWALDLGSDVDCAPAVGDDGTVYVGVDDNALVAVDPGQGKVRWRTNVGGHVRGSLTLTRNRSVIAGVYGPSPAVVAVDAMTGALRWRFAVRGTGATEFGVHGSPVEDAAGALYFGAQDDHVYSLAADGSLRWKLATGADVDAPVVLGLQGRLYAASDDGKLYCVIDRASR